MTFLSILDVLDLFLNQCISERSPPDIYAYEGVPGVPEPHRPRRDTSGLLREKNKHA